MSYTPAMRIHLSSVMVGDQEKAFQFYTDVLGFVKKAGIPITSFETKDIKGDYARLKEKGVVFRGEMRFLGPVDQDPAIGLIFLNQRRLGVQTKAAP